MAVLPVDVQGVSWPSEAQPVLRNLTWRIAGDGITAILGENGAGKSSLLRLVAGLIRPAVGTVTWRGATTPPAAIRWVAQQPQFLRASVATNLWFAAVPLPGRWSAKRKRISAVLERVGLAERANEPALRLSGGERQRLALARAWLAQPELLLLDEPTANLDPGATAAVERLIQEMRSSGIRIVMTTHHLAQAARLSDEVVFLADGEISEQTPTRQFFAAPKSVAARRFIRSETPWWFRLPE